LLGIPIGLTYLIREKGLRSLNWGHVRNGSILSVIFIMATCHFAGPWFSTAGGLLLLIQSNRAVENYKAHLWTLSIIACLIPLWIGLILFLYSDRYTPSAYLPRSMLIFIPTVLILSFCGGYFDKAPNSNKSVSCLKKACKLAFGFGSLYYCTILIDFLDVSFRNKLILNVIAAVIFLIIWNGKSLPYTFRRFVSAIKARFTGYR
jgi:hypothetical protein